MSDIAAEFECGAGECVRNRLERVERALGFQSRGGIRTRVRDVVVIASSSRGGSSMLAELLRRTPQLLHFRAEVNPFFVLSGLSYPASGTGSDLLPASHAYGHALDVLDERMAMDVGVASDDADNLRRFPRELAWRFAMQWPQLDLDVLEIAALAQEVGQQVDVRLDLQRYYVRLLRRLRERYPDMNAWYYDLIPHCIEDERPVPPAPQGPPADVVVEEPPFVAIQPWRLANDDDLARRPLIVKTPSNAYRLEFLRALFPHARFRVLHLCRNAAAAINGLVDGWRYRGFYSHPTDCPLAIAGYSDVEGPWARRWWKFDLPPDWNRYTSSALIEVCAFQWRAAHEWTLRSVENLAAADTLRVHFEDVVGTRARREATIGRIADWLGIAVDVPLAAAIRDGMPPVMATATPRQRRWFQKAALLEPMLARPEIREMMERLGYGHDPKSWE